MAKIGLMKKSTRERKKSPVKANSGRAGGRASAAKRKRKPPAEPEILEIETLAVEDDAQEQHSARITDGQVIDPERWRQELNRRPTPDTDEDELPDTTSGRYR